jgi:hypothetical protein
MIFSEFEDDIIEKLKKSELIARFSETEFKTSASLDVVIKAFEVPSMLF